MNTTSSRVRSYTELKQFKTFEERYEYLRLAGTIGYETFGFDRYLNQDFYKHDPEWKRVKRDVIARDMGRDLGIKGREIGVGDSEHRDYICVHHMNPITKEDILNRSEYLLNPEYLICCTDRTHKAIHYGNKEGLIRDTAPRTPGDTCPWK